MVIETSVQFEEEPLQTIQMEEGESSRPPLDNVREASSEFFDSNFDDEDQHVIADPNPPTRPKWAKEILEVT